MARLDTRAATRGPTVSVILGANDRPRLERFLALLDFASDDGRSYVSDAVEGFEFWFVEAPAEPTVSEAIFVSIAHRADAGAFLAAVDDIGLAHEAWEHPGFCDVRVTDPSGRVWQVMLRR